MRFQSFSAEKMLRERERAVEIQTDNLSLSAFSVLFTTIDGVLFYITLAHNLEITAHPYSDIQPFPFTLCTFFYFPKPQTDRQRERERAEVMGEKSRLQAGVKVFENVEELSTGLADYIAQLSEANVRERGAFTLAISGGDVPKLLRKLTERPYVRTVDWPKWHIFWADETLVAKTHQLSHYRQARQEFLSKVPVLPRHVYPVNVVVSGEQAAEEYEFMVRQRVKDQTVRVASGSDHPMFDLILLSLEPNSPPLLLASNNGDEEEEEEGGVGWVRHVKGTPERITFTLPVLNAAANIALLASSSSSSALRHCSYGNLDHGISPVDGHLDWFVHAAVGSPGSSPDS